MKKFLGLIFSSVNIGEFKVITIFGLKFKIENYAPALHRIEAALGRFNSRYDLPNLSIEHSMFLLAGIQTAEYVMKNMDKVKTFDDKLELLSYAFSISQKDGLNLEFGVFSGETINHLSSKYPTLKFYGFDSFEGLPEAWRSNFEKGMFACEGLPKVNQNVELIKGWFDSSLPDFVAKEKEYCSFIHIDCDIYSSTKTVFDLLADRIKSGTVIVFDEYFNYPNWQKHEFKAFQEFVAANGIKYEYIGYVTTLEQAAVRII